MSKVSTQVKFHNPKAHSPAVYIPCWLIQIDSHQLSHQAKLLYGRLAQWSNANGIVYRSVKQLMQELGFSSDCVERTLKELRDVKLIETYQIKPRGVNHYKFLENEWMREPINQNLEYDSPVPPKTDIIPIPAKMRVHTRKSAGTIIEEIKRNNKTTTTTKEKTKSSGSSSSDFIINETADSKLLQLRDEYLPADVFDRNDREFLKQCSHHLDNGDKTRYNFPRRMKGLESIIKAGFFETPAGYNERKVVKSLFTPEEVALIHKYSHALRMVELGANLKDYMPDKEEVKKAIKLLAKEEKLKNPV